MDTKKIGIIVIVLIHLFGECICRAQGDNYISGDEYAAKLYYYLDSLSTTKQKDVKLFGEGIHLDLIEFMRIKQARKRLDMEKQSRIHRILETNFVFQDGNYHIVCKDIADLAEVLHYYSFSQICSVKDTVLNEHPVKICFMLTGSGIIQKRAYVFELSSDEMLLSCVYAKPIIDDVYMENALDASCWSIDYSIISEYVPLIE